MIQLCCTPGQKSLRHIKEQHLNAFLVQIHGEYINLLSVFKVVHQASATAYLQVPKHELFYFSSIFFK